MKLHASHSRANVSKTSLWNEENLWHKYHYMISDGDTIPVNQIVQDLYIYILDSTGLHSCAKYVSWLCDTIMECHIKKLESPPFGEFVCLGVNKYRDSTNLAGDPGFLGRSGWILFDHVIRTGGSFKDIGHISKDLPLVLGREVILRYFEIHPEIFDDFERWCFLFRTRQVETCQRESRHWTSN